jgi:hypothetical protein
LPHPFARPGKTTKGAQTVYELAAGFIVVGLLILVASLATYEI